MSAPDLKEQRPNDLAAGAESVRGAWAAACVTVVDGYDAFSMSLAAPAIARDLHLPTSALGPLFASTMGGMIAGAVLGGLLADRLGKVRILILALSLFGGAALLVPSTTQVGGLIANRLVAGMGLGAAAPIAVALLNQVSVRAPSDFVVSLVWGGIPLGGVLAAAFNFAVVPHGGWRSLFLAGAILPLAAAAASFWAFRDTGLLSHNNRKQPSLRARTPTSGRAIRAVTLAAMFFFGYVTTAIIVNWLPTVLDHEGASAATISVTFAAINVGSAAGIFLLGFISSILRWRFSLAVAWAAAGLFAIAAAWPVGISELAIAAVVAATLAAGCQGLSVALANVHGRGSGRESTTIGMMVGAGRIGQFAALALTGLLLAKGVSERALFAFAGSSALIAAFTALLFTWLWPRARPLRVGEDAADAFRKARLKGREQD